MNDFADQIQLFRRFVHSDEAGDGAEGSRDEASWKSFGELITRHQVAHFVLARIEAGHAPGPVPDSFLTTLLAAVERRRERMEGLIALMPQLDHALREAGVDYLVLKGLVFAARYYDDVSHRPQNDIDVLVRREDLSAALAAMQGLDLRPKTRRVRKTGTGLTIRSHLLRTEHAMVLSRGDLGVDLHWSLRTAPAYRFDEAALWEARQTVTIDGVSYPTLSDEHALLLVLVSLAHDIGRGAGRLKHVLDMHRILMMIEGSIDWNAFLDDRSEDNTLTVVVNVLDLYLRVVAGRARHPDIVSALEEHDACIVVRDDGDAITLFERPKGDPRNHRWFLKVYPVSWWRDSIWWIDRNVPHPGRLLVALSKATRYAGRCGWQLVRSGSRRAS